MAFSLGSIYVELVANTAKFLSGMDAASVAARKTGKDIRSGLGEVGNALAALGPAGQQIGSVLDGIGNKANEAFTVASRNGRGFGTLMAGSVLGGVTALAGGMFALAEHAADVGAKIYDASQKTGISAGQMSGLMAIAKETGGNFDGLTNSLARASVNLEKTAQGAGKTNKTLFDMMGGAKGAAELGLQPMGDRIQAVLKHIFALNDVGQRNLALNQLLGRGWMGNVTTLKLLAGQGYGPAIQKAREFGIYFDAEHAAQAKQFQASLAEMKGDIASLGMTIGQWVIPKIRDWMQGLQGLSARWEAFKKILSAGVAIMSGDLSGARDRWHEYEEANKKADQAQTDFLVHLQNVAAGAGKGADGENKLTHGIKAHADALAALIERERDEMAELRIHGNKSREIQAEYDRTVREINKAVAAGGSYSESLIAQGLALDILRKKIMDYLLTFPTMIPKLPWLQMSKAPDLKIPSLPGLPDALGVPHPLNQTLSQLAKLTGQADSTRGEFKALREETELSDVSFARLAAAFPGLTEAEVAATAAGRNMIEQLTKLDKLGTASEQFTEFKNRLIVDGNDLAGHLIHTLGGALDQLEDQLAHLAMTGKANFKQLAQGIGGQILKAGMQKGVSSILGHFGISAGGGKPEGTQGSPFWVKLIDKIPGSGGLLPGGGGSAAPSEDAGGGGGSALGQAANGLGSIASSLDRLFAGFLASGGDVSPGHAYVVGERHPELFVPRAAGSVVPSLRSQEVRPLTYAPTFHINTPNPDAFRRSQNQILTEGYRTMLVVHGRNS